MDPMKENFVFHVGASSGTPNKRDRGRRRPATKRSPLSGGFPVPEQQFVNSLSQDQLSFSGEELAPEQQFVNSLSQDQLSSMTQEQRKLLEKFYSLQQQGATTVPYPETPPAFKSASFTSPPAPPPPPQPPTPWTQQQMHLAPCAPAADAPPRGSSLSQPAIPPPPTRLRVVPPPVPPPAPPTSARAPVVPPPIPPPLPSTMPLPVVPPPLPPRVSPELFFTMGAEKTTRPKAKKNSPKSAARSVRATSADESLPATASLLAASPKAPFLAAAPTAFPTSAFSASAFSATAPDDGHSSPGPGPRSASSARLPAAELPPDGLGSPMFSIGKPEVRSSGRSSSRKGKPKRQPFAREYSAGPQVAVAEGPSTSADAGAAPFSFGEGVAPSSSGPVEDLEKRMKEVSVGRAPTQQSTWQVSPPPPPCPHRGAWA